MKVTNTKLSTGQRLVVGLIFNCKHGDGGDSEAEFDTPETIHAITKALEARGYIVKPFEANKTLAEALTYDSIDIAFNIAEGLRGRGREAEVPAILNLLGIPFVGSDETALCIALDKALCKRLVSTYGIPSPVGLVCHSMDDLKTQSLQYPVIIKPNAEGSSKGIPDACIATTPDELRSMLTAALQNYQGGILVEEYIQGREFTVGILGNGKNATVFSPMEIAFRKKTYHDFQIYSYGVKQNYKQFVDYKCPADISPELDRSLRQSALTVFNALGCQDFARVDFRVSLDGTPYFIEINPLPGLAPDYSDFPMLAQFCGVSYNDLIQKILEMALARLKRGGM